MPSAPSAPAGALSTVIPVLPTTAREFARVERVAAFVRLYQGGKAPVASLPVTIRIRDTGDQLIVDETRTLEAAAFVNNRASDLRFDLPVARLRPGSYLLSFEAALNKSAVRRDVRFAVK